MLQLRIVFRKCPHKEIKEMDNANTKENKDK